MIKNLAIYVFLIPTVLAGCGDKKAEVETKVPVNYHSRFIPQRVDQKSDTSFSLTLSVKDSLFVIGDRNGGHSIYLLNNETGESMQVKTGPSREYFEEISDVHWKLTPIAPQPEDDKRYDLAFRDNGPIDFRLIKSEAITDSATISDLDREIKLSGYIDTLLAYDDKFPTDSVIGLIKPEIVEVQLRNHTAFIVTYNYIDSIPGPRMIILDSMIFPLTGPCSYQHIYPFQINERQLIQTGSSCCECGWVIDQVFEIVDDRVLLIFQDDSYSE